MYINSIQNFKQNFSGIISQSNYECFLKKYPKLTLSNCTKIISDDCIDEFFYTNLDNFADFEAINEIFSNNMYIDSNFANNHWNMDLIDISEGDFKKPIKYINPKTNSRGYKFKDGTIMTSHGDKFKPVKTNEFKEALSFIPVDNDLYLKAYTAWNSLTGKLSRKFELLSEDQFKKVVKGNKKIHGALIDFDKARDLLGY